MLSILLLLVGTILPINGIYQSVVVFSSMSFQYQPENAVQLISINTAQTKLRCSAACNQLSSCRIFDYDSVSQRCRLFEGDITTGSIIPSSSSTSVVGTVRIDSTLYSPIYNQSCQSCQQNRYEVCSANTTTCQCPPHSYWDGSVCALQLFQNDACSQLDMCRSDLNLTCGSNCNGYVPQCLQSVLFVYSKYRQVLLVFYSTKVQIIFCQGLEIGSIECSIISHSRFFSIFIDATASTSIGFGTTIAGACNSSTYANATALNNPTDILLVSSNTLYVADYSNRTLVFTLNSLTARVLTTFGNWPAFMHLDNRTSNIYITVTLLHLVYIWPTNQTIPPNGIPGGNCSLSTVRGPTGITVDSVGNVYISSLYCNWITKWAPNATSSTLFAGSPTGNSGWDNVTLYEPYGLALDEVNSFLYVADRYNSRIQRFPLNGSGVGVTVAGDLSTGTASNELYRPIDVYLSKLDGSLYIVDCYNNRIQKWAQNATFGITVAGDPNGASGNTPYLLDRPFAFAFDNQEQYMYVSDGLNNRIQRFTLQ
jgi:hypothetical protein